MLVKLGSADLEAAVFKLFQPFTKELWFATLIAMLFTAGVRSCASQLLDQSLARPLSSVG